VFVVTVLDSLFFLATRASLIQCLSATGEPEVILPCLNGAVRSESFPGMHTNAETS
jgi:hypothetical protein